MSSGEEDDDGAESEVVGSADAEGLLPAVEGSDDEVGSAEDVGSADEEGSADDVGSDVDVGRDEVGRVDVPVGSGEEVRAGPATAGRDAVGSSGVRAGAAVVLPGTGTPGTEAARRAFVDEGSVSVVEGVVASALPVGVVRALPDAAAGTIDSGAGAVDVGATASHAGALRAAGALDSAGRSGRATGAGSVVRLHASGVAMTAATATAPTT